MWVGVESGAAALNSPPASAFLCISNEVGAPSFAPFAKEPALSAVEGWESRTLALRSSEIRPHFSQNPRELEHPHIGYWEKQATRPALIPLSPEPGLEWATNKLVQWFPEWQRD